MVQTPVDELHSPATWHWSRGVQTNESVPVQTPAWHLSLRVQASPSLQLVPDKRVWSQPCPAVQKSVVQALSSLQERNELPVHTPEWQIDSNVHGSPSSQSRPSAKGTAWHRPVAAMHSERLQTSPAGVSQVMMVAESTMHCPRRQTRVPLHLLPSSNLVQSAALRHPQSVVWSPRHLPWLHLSFVVQPLPSLHPCRLGVKMHPTAPSHESFVQGLSSSQVISIPPRQVPDRQDSPRVHLSSSSQGVPSSTLCSTQRPVAGAQAASIHFLPDGGWQWTSAAGSTMQNCPSQTSRPRQRSPFSFKTQSASLSQVQVLVPLPHDPLAH